MDGKEIRVALADDHSMVRQALASMLEAEPDLVVAGQGGDAQEALELLEREHPDVLVLDYNMPNGGAMAVLSKVREAGSPVRVLVLTVNDSVHYAQRALEAGAAGYLIKSSAVEELVEAIRIVQGGGTYVTPKYREAVTAEAADAPAQKTGLASLSEREFEILRDLAAGKSLKESAFDHEIGISTVSTYRSRIMRKLGFRSTSDLIRFALENDVLA